MKAKFPKDGIINIKDFDKTGHLFLIINRNVNAWANNIILNVVIRKIYILRAHLYFCAYLGSYSGFSLYTERTNTAM